MIKTNEGKADLVGVDGDEGQLEIVADLSDTLPCARSARIYCRFYSRSFTNYSSNGVLAKSRQTLTISVIAMGISVFRKESIMDAGVIDTLYTF